MTKRRIFRALAVTVELRRVGIVTAPKRLFYRVMRI
jgi:hypothetical protein